MRFWLVMGVDGFRVDAIPHLFEDERLRDEPLSGKIDDPDNYGYLDHIYTKDMPKNYEMIRQWRDVIDEYSKEDNVSRVMMVEAYTNEELTMKYYDFGAHFPFNFNFITGVNENSTASDFKNVIDRWMSNMPEGATANWVVSEKIPFTFLINRFRFIVRKKIFHILLHYDKYI